MRKKPHVLILGAGFAGLGAAQRLEDAEAEVTLIDMHNYHTFQPMLYQVATDLIANEEVGHPIRDIFRRQRNLSFHQATSTKVDLSKRQVYFQEIDPLSYDYLVFALGARVNFYGVKGAEEHAFPMYTLPDAVRLKQHILERWESADKDPTIIEDGALDVLVVGGGPTGVESAGALIELYRGNFVKDYPNLPAEKARIILVDYAPVLLGMFKKDIQRYTHKALEKRGVEVWFGDGVVEVTPTRVTLKSGEVVKTHTLVWGAGLLGNPMVHSLGVQLEKGQRISVGPDLRLAGHPEVFVVGDSAWITDTKTNSVLPQLGSVALQSGELAGENIAHLLVGGETSPFQYLDKGTMATIGRGAAVLQMPNGKTMKGKTASLAWGTVHLALLTGGDSRTKTMVDWGWAAFTRKRSGRISVDITEK
jgi:NADH dehydrogenase